MILDLWVPLFSSYNSGGIIIMGTAIGYFRDHDNRGIIKG